MQRQQATLIQDLFHFLEIIQTPLQQALQTFANEGIEEEATLYWLVVESIEKIYCLNVNDHHRKLSPYWQIDGYLRNVLTSMNIDYDQLFTWYIKAPKIYDALSDVVVEIRGRDLYITYLTPYYTSPQL